MIRRWLEAMVLAGLCAPGLAQAEASVRLMTSPVAAGELVHLEAHIDGELRAPLRGVAAVGSVSPFVQTGPGTYRADFTPGAKVGPALVELSIYEDRVGGQLAFTLANVSDVVRAKATVKTREAVFVRAGSVRKGPFHPDAHGVVNLEFVANGELSEAQLETAQGKALGAVPLKPLLARSLLVARPARLRAGDTKPAELILVAPSNTPSRGEVRLTATAGKVLTDATQLPAGWRYGFLPPATTTDTIRVQAADARGQRLGEASFGLAGAAPRTMTLRVPGKKLGPGERITLGVNVADAKDQPTDAEITVSSDVGQLLPPVALGPGTFAVTFVAPAQLPAAGQAHLQAQVLGEDVSATGVVTFKGGAPARVVFHAPDRPVRAGEAVRVEAEVLDQAGNPAEAHALQLSADQGEVSGLEAQGGNRYAFSVRGKSDASGLTLTAHDGPTTLQGSQALSFEPEAALPGALFGIEGGVANNFGQVSTASLAVTAQLLVGPRGEAPVKAAVGLLAGYLPQATRTLRSDAATSAELQLGRVALLARGGAFGALGPVGLYGGVAAGIVKLSGQLASVGRAPLPLDAVRPAFGLYGGAGYKLGPGYLALELSATQATVDVQNSELRAHGPVGGLDGALAYLFAL